MLGHTRYYIWSGFFDSVCFANSPREAATIAYKEFYKGQEIEHDTFVKECFIKKADEYVYDTFELLSKAGWVSE